MDKKEVNNYLDELVENKKIDSWKLEEHRYWSNVPAIYFGDKRLFLCEVASLNGTTNIDTVYDCKNEKELEKYINYIFDNIDIIKSHYFWDVGELKKFML